MTRNFAIFLALLAALIVAAPFMERKDGLGWLATIVGILAMLLMLAMWLRRTAENLRDWWHDDLD